MNLEAPKYILIIKMCRISYTIVDDFGVQYYFELNSLNSEHFLHFALFAGCFIRKDLLIAQPEGGSISPLYVQLLHYLYNRPNQLSITF